MAYKKGDKGEPKEKKDYYQQVTNEIIEAMEKGALPFQKGWDSKVGGCYVLARLAELVSGAIRGRTLSACLWSWAEKIAMTRDSLLLIRPKNKGGLSARARRERG